MSGLQNINSVLVNVKDMISTIDQSFEMGASSNNRTASTNITKKVHKPLLFNTG